MSYIHYTHYNVLNKSFKGTIARATVKLTLKKVPVKTKPEFCEKKITNL